MTLAAYRDSCLRAYDAARLRDIETMKLAIRRVADDPYAIRGVNMTGLYSAALAKGPLPVRDAYVELEPIFENQCKLFPGKSTSGEITLAGHANLFASCGYADHTHYFGDRLVTVRTDRNGSFAQWHFGKVLAGIALERKTVYREPVGAVTAFHVPLPFTPRSLHGYNPQSLLAHLAGAVENHVDIGDVWPAFEECVFNFPRQEATGEFDGACLFWIARIVHHQVGRQPVGQTCSWLHRHFNAWANGKALPPLCL